MTNADFYKNMLYFEGTVYHYLTENEAVNAYMTVLFGEAVPTKWRTKSFPVTHDEFGTWATLGQETEIKPLAKIFDDGRQGNE